VQPEPPETDAAPRPQLGKPRSENRIPWAELIRRVFLIDLLTCDKCGGLRDVRAIVPKAKAREVLEALAIPFMPLSIAKTRDPPCWLPRSSALPFPASIPELSAAFPGVWSPVA
jgi:hypothetical protein